MNSKKHKNKKSNKQPNLNISQNDEPKVDVKNTQISKTECEIKECILEKPSEDVKQEIEVTTPKKPKRNKGKKKKQDKGDECENEQENIPLEVSKEIKVKETENVNQNLPDAVPIVKKKKNKKHVGDASSDFEMILLSDKPSLEIESEQKVKDEPDVVSKNDEKLEILEEAIIAKKKNKKKKHRTDSEKSDKSSEAMSCTSAFQKLLDADEGDIPNEEIKEIKTEMTDAIVSDIAATNIEIKSVETLGSTLKVSVDADLHSKIEKPIVMSVDQMISSRDKKKNRKEKKHPHNITDQGIAQPIVFQEQPIKESSEKISETDKTKNDTSENPAHFIVKEDSPKPKAKIAKPVEKKRKESDFKNPSNECESDGTTIISEETSENFMKTQILEEESKSETYKIENIILDESTTIKNSSKTTRNKISSKTSDANKTTFNITDETTILYEDTKRESAEVSQDVIKDDIKFETLVPSEFEMKSSEDKLNEILDTVIKASDDNKYKEKSCEETKKSMDNIEKSRKKSKKTPKIIINPEISATTTDFPKEYDTLKASRIDDNKSCAATPSDSVEIRSVKDESEDLICDVVPDVRHPRSSSEQLTDENNNTIIQEVFEDSLSLPMSSLEKPLIQGSGETPTDTPEMFPSRNKSVEKDISLKSGEKTDIKSKMIEVNRDMEELRLSIERSLAGLNVLEKSSEISEKQLTDKNIFPSDIITKTNLIESTTSKLNENATLTKKQGTTDLPIDVSAQVNYKEEKIIDIQDEPSKLNTEKVKDTKEIMLSADTVPPICPTRREHRKGKKRKDKQEESQSINTLQSSSNETSTKDTKTEKTSEQKSNATEEKSKQQSSTTDNENEEQTNDEQQTKSNVEVDYEPIENFEDALTSSADDINKTFEMIVNQMTESSQRELACNKPEINIIAPIEDTEQKDVKKNRVTPPKNLLGHPNIPVRSNKTDYKKVKDKTPNTKQAKVNIKEEVLIENFKESKESQAGKKNECKRQIKLKDSESFCQISNCDDFIYKYSFRKVFLQSTCHVCQKELVQFRVPCKFCNLLFYCSLKHKEAQHQALCFAISTIGHIKDQKHIYADVKNITGHNYRLLRMQTILSCEKVLKRRLVPWEQEILLYPRMCAEISCREWRQSRLKDCEKCGQISYCSNHVDHLPKTHQRWCKSYALYQKLVTYQQTKGRLEPKLPTKILKDYEIPEKINEVLAAMFEEKIDLNDVEYAALTQIATAPLTVAFCYQICKNVVKSTSKDHYKTSFTIHVVGAELQFEADVLNKWETFFLHLRSDVKELRIVLINPELNPGKLPLELLGKIKLCTNCYLNKRRVVFSFQDMKTYQEYRNSDDFIYPDIVCTFNPSLHRSSIYNGKDTWPSTTTSVMKLRVPFIITGHTINDLNRDLARVNEFSEPKVIVEPRSNPFSSVRPDRNFISDDEIPLLFKNHCFMVLCGL